MNTVADLVRARSASRWMEVLGGKVPRERRDVKVRGRRRSCSGGQSRGYIGRRETRGMVRVGHSRFI